MAGARIPDVKLHDAGPPSSEAAGYHERPRPELVDIARQYGLSGRVLDVGCAAGVLGADLLAAGLATEVVGVEQDPGAAEKAATRLTRVVCEDISDPALYERLPHRFDAMIFADVLEHLADPLPVLLRLTERLRGDGLCLISLPNVRYFRVLADVVLRNDWVYTSQGVCDTTHLRFFTARSAARLCEQARLRVLGIHVPLYRRAARVARLVPALMTFLSAQVILVARPER